MQEAPCQSRETVVREERHPRTSVRGFQAAEDAAASVIEEPVRVRKKQDILDTLKDFDLPQHWALWLRIDGDLRFASHHDLMRAIQRLCARAGIALRYSQGFNPHPVMSLACPRPVGVASQDDVVVLALDDEPGSSAIATADDLLRCANACAPEGMTFTRGEKLQGKKTLRPRRIEYELVSDPAQQAALAGRISELQNSPCWPTCRQRPGNARRSEMQSKEIDLRPLVQDMRLEGGVLRWTLVPSGEVWARPGEILELLGLDARSDLARLRRTAVQYE